MANESVTDVWAARFPQIGRAKGHYESFYLKACHPTEPKAVWIRYTVHKVPGAEATGSTWFTYFDRSSEPLARKTTLPSPGASSGTYITIGESFFGPGRAHGTTDGVSWALETHAVTEPLMHLPKPWMYTAPVPRTKSISPASEAVFSGPLSMPGGTVELDAWPGMWGHNWGTEHAERWVWAHAIFDSGTWLDVVMGRIKIGGVTTPWVANGALSINGLRHRLGGIGKTRSTRVNETVNSVDFELPGEIPVVGRVVRSPDQTVAWPYADPSGGTHHSLNRSIAGGVVCRP
jgi:hypothetical protein